jgi:hypothetical protein
MNVENPLVVVFVARVLKATFDDSEQSKDRFRCIGRRRGERVGVRSASGCCTRRLPRLDGVGLHSFIVLFFFFFSSSSSSSSFITFRALYPRRPEPVLLKSISWKPELKTREIVGMSALNPVRRAGSLTPQIWWATIYLRLLYETGAAPSPS